LWGLKQERAFFCLEGYRGRYRALVILLAKLYKRLEARDTRYYGEVAGLARELIEAEVGDSNYQKRKFFAHGVYLAEGWRTWVRMWGPPLGEGNVCIPQFILD